MSNISNARRILKLHSAEVLGFAQKYVALRAMIVQQQIPANAVEPIIEAARSQGDIVSTIYEVAILIDGDTQIISQTYVENRVGNDIERLREGARACAFLMGFEGVTVDGRTLNEILFAPLVPRLAPFTLSDELLEATKTLAEQ